METTYDFTVNFDLTWIILVIAGYLLFKGIKATFKVKNVEEAKLDLEEEFLPDDKTKFNITGDGNHWLSGMIYEGRRIPDVSIVNRQLFIDGKFKRKVSKTAKVYNRGTGIFVDGKYVG